MICITINIITISYSPNYSFLAPCELVHLSYEVRIADRYSIRQLILVNDCVSEGQCIVCQMP